MNRYFRSKRQNKKLIYTNLYKKIYTGGSQQIFRKKGRIIETQQLKIEWNKFLCSIIKYDENWKF